MRTPTLGLRSLTQGLHPVTPFDREVAQLASLIETQGLTPDLRRQLREIARWWTPLTCMAFEPYALQKAGYIAPEGWRSSGSQRPLAWSLTLKGELAIDQDR